MSEEVTSTVKTASDGTVKIAIEKYNDLMEKANKPPVINRTVVQKTAKMLAQEHRAWGITLMGLGAGFFAVGAIRYKLGQNEPNI